MKCSVKNCDKPHRAKGFCHSHYQKQYLYHRYHTIPHVRKKLLANSKKWREENYDRFLALQQKYYEKRKARLAKLKELERTHPELFV